jgi:hypothetical protein
MGLSIRAYAKQRGVSEAAVRKAIKTGRITLSADKTLDPRVANDQWLKNTDSSQQRSTASGAKSVSGTSEPSADLMKGSSTTFVQARTANEVVKAQTNKVRLAKLKSELIDRAQALALVFKLARSERDAWLNWPARVSAAMAVALGVDAHTLHVQLESATRQHLQELGELRLKVDE